MLIRIAPLISRTFSAVSTRKSALHKEDLECETVPQTQRLSLGSSFRYFLADRVGMGGRENNAIDCIQAYWVFDFVNPFSMLIRKRSQEKYFGLNQESGSRIEC